MRPTSNIPWQAFEQRRNQLQFLLRSKFLAVHDDDMRRGSQELRALYPDIATVKAELNVLRRVIAKQGDIDDDHSGEQRSGVEYRYATQPMGTPTAAATDTSSGSPLLLRGFAVLWNQPSELLAGSFREMFVPSAFDESLRDDEQDFLIEHLPPSIASTADGTLTLKATKDGLHFEARLDKSKPLIQRAERKLRERRHMSFMFFKLKDRWTEQNGVALRTVLKAKLGEISAVREPAYKQSSLQVAERSNWQAQAAARGRQLKLLTMR